MAFKKKYSFKIAVFLILLGSTAMFYWIGFHKTFNEQSIPQNSDRVVMVDVKNIRNFFICSYLKNPTQWQTTETIKSFDLSDLSIEFPDYLAFFHLENQPETQWFTVAKIENETEFENKIIKIQFSKENLNNRISSYYSKSMGLFILKHSNQILISKISKNHKLVAIKVAEDLFLKKLFLDSKKMSQTIGTNNAVTVWIKKNSFLKEDGIVNITLKDQEIVAEGQLKLHSKYRKNYLFLENPNAVLSIGFNFEMIQNQNFFKQNLNQINKIIGFNVDSLLVHHPTKTEIIVHEMVKKNDSVISYDYDDDFNPIKKVVVHTNREPSFYFSIQTENSKQVYDYLKNQNAIDKNQVFVNFPLAQTKTFVKNNTLTLKANPIKQASIKSSIPKMGYLQMNFSKLQTNDWRYLIGKNKNLKYLQSFEILSVNLKLENNQAHFLAHLKTNNKKSLITIMK